MNSKKTLSRIVIKNKNYTVFIGLSAIFIFSLFFSKFLLSVSIGLLFLLSFIDFNMGLSLRISNFKNVSNKRFLCLCSCFFGLFVITLASYFNSENTAVWLHFVKLKLPFILLPIAFLNWGKIERRAFNLIISFFILVACISAVLVLSQYLINFEEITQSIGRGKTIPTPLDHGKYSVLICMAIFCSLILNFEKQISEGWVKKLIWIAAGFLFSFLHVLAVRSGLVILYFGLLFLMGYYLLKAQSYFFLIAFLATLILLPVIAYQAVPSFKNKVGYTLYDLKMQKAGGGENYSDGERSISFKLGYKLFKSQPYYGVGIGDLRDLMTQEYKLNHPRSQKIILPHNQYLIYAAGYGLLGLLLFILLIYYPLRYCELRKSMVYLIFVMSATLLFMVEKPLEEAVFVAFFTYFSLLIYNQEIL